MRFNIVYRFECKAPLKEHLVFWWETVFGFVFSSLLWYCETRETFPPESVEKANLKANQLAVLFCCIKISTSQLIVFFKINQLQLTEQSHFRLPRFLLRFLLWLVHLVRHSDHLTKLFFFLLWASVCRRPPRDQFSVGKSFFGLLRKRKISGFFLDFPIGKWFEIQISVFDIFRPDFGVFRPENVVGDRKL